MTALFKLLTLKAVDTAESSDRIIVRFGSVTKTFASISPGQPLDFTLPSDRRFVVESEGAVQFALNLESFETGSEPSLGLGFIALEEVGLGPLTRVLRGELFAVSGPAPTFDYELTYEVVPVQVPTA